RRRAHRPPLDGGLHVPPPSADRATRRAGARGRRRRAPARAVGVQLQPLRRVEHQAAHRPRGWRADGRRLLPRQRVAPGRGRAGSPSHSDAAIARCASCSSTSPGSPLTPTAPMRRSPSKTATPPRKNVKNGSKLARSTGSSRAFSASSRVVRASLRAAVYALRWAFRRVSGAAPSIDAAATSSPWVSTTYTEKDEGALETTKSTIDRARESFTTR